jgi:NAD(P)-dependent dehydrogenase (short-subunit alcohol dehydrogenase family)
LGKQGGSEKWEDHCGVSATPHLRHRTYNMQKVSSIEIILSSQPASYCSTAKGYTRLYQKTMSSSSESSLGRLKGKVAIVTGGASPLGFGFAITRRFVEEGAKVIIGDLDGSGAESVASSLSTQNVRGVAMDVCKLEDWQRVVETAIKEFGRLDIVVNNAGTTYRNKPTAEVTEDEFERVMSVNVKSIFWSVKTVVPQMQKQGGGGSIINISSSGSIRPRPGLVWYNASKGAVSNVSLVIGRRW